MPESATTVQAGNRFSGTLAPPEWERFETLLAHDNLVVERIVSCGRGHNRLAQGGDPSVHGETEAFRKASRQRRYKNTIMVTTLSPCWYCSGLVRQFGIGTVVVGESVSFDGGTDWLQQHDVEVIDLHDEEYIAMLGEWIAAIRKCGTRTSASTEHAGSTRRH